ncbi:pyrroline-5-carboxylate reductase 2-like, partial [Brachionus plicatilis]
NVCSQINHLISENHLILSICAGITIKKLISLVSLNKNDESLRISRCMLNTAALVGSSCSVFSQNGALKDSDKNLITKILSSIGICIGEIKDSDMDAAMSICACSIAYMYMMVDSMADGGVKMGLSREVALKLSMQTMKGASEIMISQHGIKHPMQLKDEVCSPGGTTIQGLHELERNGFRNSVICAIESATNRAKQFS